MHIDTQPELYLGHPIGDDVDRDRQAFMLGRAVELSGIGRQLDTVDDRAEFLHGLTDNSFNNFLIAMNGIVLNLPRTRREFSQVLQVTMDAEPQLVITDVMPHYEQKSELLSKSLEIAQSLDNVHHSALVLGFGINAIHPFLDGNGRVARAVYVLLSRNHRTSGSDLTDAMGVDGNAEFCINPILFLEATYGVIKGKMRTHDIVKRNGFDTPLPKMTPVFSGDYGFPHVVPTNRHHDAGEMYDLMGMLTAPHISEMLPYLLIDRFQSRTVSDCVGKKNGSVYFLVDKFLKIATPKDVENVFKVFNSVKKQYVTTLLQSIAGYENKDFGMYSVLPKVPGVYKWTEYALYAAEGLFTTVDKEKTNKRVQRVVADNSK